MEYREVSDAFATARGVLDWIENKVNRGFVSRLFVMKYRVKWYTPPVLFGKTQEIDEPFRYSWTLMLHVTPHRVLGFGVWSKAGLPEHRALLKAVRSGLTTTEEDMEHFDDTIARERTGIDGVGAFSARLRTSVSDAGTRFVVQREPLDPDGPIELTSD
jgi:hypothetical protein